MLIAEYHLSNDRIGNSDQNKSCCPISLFLDHLESLDLRFGSEIYDSNTKIYPVRI